MRGIRLIAVVGIAWIAAAGTVGADEVPPPETTIDAGPAEGSSTLHPTPTFTFSSSEPGSTFACSVDGASFAACISPDRLAHLSDGSHTFAVQAIDAVGIADPTPALRNFRIDATPPDGIILKAPLKQVKTTHQTVQVTFVFLSSEPATSFLCSMDGVAAMPCGSPKTYTVRKGRHRFLLFASDPSHNFDPTPDEFTFKVERIKPAQRSRGLDRPM
ncbi:MAG: large repetitive protein [Solirubrobacterales bacterium]|nr:large repetitive protein [Solirubrobacterales bacterium]